MNNKKILVIEDNAEMADNISSILELANYHVVHATNGKEGVTLAQQNHPDLILCDIMMPELDGYGVLHVLSKDPETATIPFVFLTAKSDRGDLRAAMNLGADDYITKPFDSVDLLKVVETRLRKIQSLKSALINEQVPDNLDHATAIRQLTENRPVRAFRKKDMIFMEGQSAYDLYFIKKGQVKTYKLNYDGKELITGIYEPDDFIGFVPLLKDTQYNENAEALVNAEIAIIPKTDFLSLMYSNKEMTKSFIKMLSHNIDEMENRLLDIAYHSVRQRVARILIKIEEQFTGLLKEGMITMSRKDLANIVGTATESLNRTLADFREEGLVALFPHGVKIANKRKLQKLTQ